jgi:hypothetical protein
VRIKRPGGEEPREIDPSAEAGEETAPAEHAAAAAAPVAEDDTHWVFPALSFVAILVVAVLIYIIMATGLVTDLGWIGKVVISR